MCLTHRFSSREEIDSYIPTDEFYCYKYLNVRNGKLVSPAYTDKVWKRGSMTSSGISRGNGDSGIYVFMVKPGPNIKRLAKHGGSSVGILRMKCKRKDVVWGGHDQWGTTKGVCLVMKHVEISDEDYDDALDPNQDFKAIEELRKIAKKTIKITAKKKAVRKKQVVAKIKVGKKKAVTKRKKVATATTKVRKKLTAKVKTAKNKATNIIKKAKKLVKKKPLKKKVKIIRKLKMKPVIKKKVVKKATKKVKIIRKLPKKKIIKKKVTTRKAVAAKAIAKKRIAKAKKKVRKSKFDSYTLAQLKLVAKTRKMTGYSGLNKADLLKRIKP